IRDRNVTGVQTCALPILWITDYGYDGALHGFDKSAGKLGVDQIDLLLLHQPVPTDFERTIGAYKALETLLADGRVRAIGISNVKIGRASCREREERSEGA